MLAQITPVRQRCFAAKLRNSSFWLVAQCICLLARLEFWVKQKLKLTECHALSSFQMVRDLMLLSLCSHEAVSCNHYSFSTDLRRKWMWHKNCYKLLHCVGFPGCGIIHISAAGELFCEVFVHARLANSLCWGIILHRGFEPLSERYPQLFMLHYRQWNPCSAVLPSHTIDYSSSLVTNQSSLTNSV